MMRGVCSTIPVGGGVATDTEEKCLSACLDTTGCRGITWSASNSTCELHDCDTTNFEDVLSFTSITCLGKIKLLDNLVVLKFAFHSLMAISRR